MLFNSPISSDKLAQLIDLLEASSTDRILDAGCGRGEMLIRVVEACGGARGLGLDDETAAVEAATKRASHRLTRPHCEFKRANLRTFSLPSDEFAVAICIGSTHAFAGGADAYPATIAALRDCVRPGGQILIGEGYWKKEPNPQYLELIGEPVGIYRSHAENVWYGEEQGLIPLYATVSNTDEWDHFEWSHRMKIEMEAAASPEDAALQSRLDRSREWRDGYLRWGRETMGFGFYLFRTTSD